MVTPPYTHTHTHPRASSALVYQLLYTSSAESAPAERSVSVCEHWWSSARLSWCRLVTMLNPALVLPETAPLVVGAKPCRGCDLLASVRVCIRVCRLCCLLTHCLFTLLLLVGRFQYSQSDTNQDHTAQEQLISL